MTGKAAMPCFYCHLNASKSASPAEIRSAYRRKALATHPDKGGTAAEFGQVVLAFETLADPSRRAEYDEKFGKCVSKHKKCESKLPRKRPRQPEEKEPQAKKQRTSKKTSNAAKPWSFERPPQCEQRKSWKPEEFENFVHRFFGRPRTELKAEVARMTQDHLEAFLLFLPNNTLEPPTVEPTQPVEPGECAEPEFVDTSDTGHLLHETTGGDVTDDGADMVEDAQFLAICDAWEDELEDLAEDTVDLGKKPCGNQRRGTTIRGIYKLRTKREAYAVVLGIGGLAIRSRFAIDLQSAINVHISFIRFREMFREKVRNGVSHEAAFLQAKAVMVAEANAANTPIKMIFVLGGDKVFFDEKKALSEWRCRRFKIYMKNLQSLLQRQAKLEEGRRAQELKKMKKREDREAKLKEGCRARELKKREQRELREQKNRWGVFPLPPGIQQASFQSENDSVYAEFLLRDGTSYLVWAFTSKFSLKSVTTQSVPTQYQYPSIFCLWTLYNLYIVVLHLLFVSHVWISVNSHVFFGLKMLKLWGVVVPNPFWSCSLSHVLLRCAGPFRQRLSEAMKDLEIASALQASKGDAAAAEELRRRDLEVMTAIFMASVPWLTRRSYVSKSSAWNLSGLSN